MSEVQPITVSPEVLDSMERDLEALLCRLPGTGSIEEAILNRGCVIEPVPFENLPNGEEVTSITAFERYRAKLLDTSEGLRWPLVELLEDESIRMLIKNILSKEYGIVQDHVYLFNEQYIVKPPVKYDNSLENSGTVFP